MENKKVKKINMMYLLGYILGPIILCAICYLIGYNFFPKGTMAVILFMVPTFAAVIWWSFGGTILFKQKRKKFEKELDNAKFNRNHTFYGKGNTVIVDESGKIGLIFFWNPFETYVLPAKSITKAWVDDGRMGSGFMEGSSRVSFLFIVDGVKVRVNTFTSNQRFRMDSNYILTGISKADMMVEVLNKAKDANKDK